MPDAGCRVHGTTASHGRARLAGLRLSWTRKSGPALGIQGAAVKGTTGRRCERNILTDLAVVDRRICHCRTGKEQPDTDD